MHAQYPFFSQQCCAASLTQAGIKQMNNTLSQSPPHDNLPVLDVVKMILTPTMPKAK
jgi:hypothetical protein